MHRDWNGFATEEERDILVNDLRFVGLFGLKDELRKNVEASIMFAGLGKKRITVRMISGDALGTAKAVALKAGITTEAELKNPHTVMHANEFRKIIGSVMDEFDEEGNEIQSIENFEKFKQIMAHLRVLARATPTDKYAITVGLQQMGKRVAVTGDGCNDALALRTADVGIAMGQEGCEVAKDAADIILTNDAFANVLTTAMWGRAIFANV